MEDLQSVPDAVIAAPFSVNAPLLQYTLIWNKSELNNDRDVTWDIKII